MDFSSRRFSNNDGVSDEYVSSYMALLGVDETNENSVTAR